LPLCGDFGLVFRFRYIENGKCGFEQETKLYKRKQFYLIKFIKMLDKRNPHLPNISSRYNFPVAIAQPKWLI